MGLQKGAKPNNPAGRKVGSKNAATTDLKIWVRGILEKNTDLFESDLLSLESKDRLSVLTTLLKYVIPSVQSTDIKIDTPKFTHIEIGYGKRDEEE